MIKIQVEEGLYLKSLELRDSEDLLPLIESNRAYLREWLPWLDMTTTIDEMIAFVDAAIRQQAAGLGFQAGIMHQDQLVGIIGYHHLEWANRSTCIGYWLSEPFQRRGIMTKASRALVEHAFEDWQLNRVEIRCAVGNMKSRAIPERLGFKSEGLLREAEWLYDHYVDHIVYGMLARDWPVVRRTQGFPASATPKQSTIETTHSSS
ncbi:MAG: GNAT family protein [Ignavibacteriales bacterium]|nr:GNAT family protein [Ignavibacteriales bacterium]